MSRAFCSSGGKEPVVDTLLSTCPHAAVCSGCLLGTERPLTEKALFFFKEQGFKDYSVVQGRTTGWRTRAKLAVRRQRGALCCGLFRRGSHEVVSIPHCLVHHPKINDALPVLYALPPRKAYDECSGEGQLRYVQFMVERTSGRVQLSLVLNLPNFESSLVHDWELWAKNLFSKEPDRWHSFWINLQPKPTNTIFGPQWKLVCGQPLMWEELCGQQIPLLPTHFSQANLGMFERLLDDLLLLLPKNQRVVDLYGGMGVIGCVVAPKCQNVTIVESSPGSQEPFLEAKRKLPAGTSIRHIVGDVDDNLDVLDEASAVIVDPPRKGLSRPVLEALKEKQVERLFYISCRFDTLERDAQALMEGGFSISWARSYLFFPGTDQIETLVLFSKNLGERI